MDIVDCGELAVKLERGSLHAALARRILASDEEDLHTIRLLLNRVSVHLARCDVHG